MSDEGSAETPAPRQPSPFQFGLRGMLVTVAVVALLLGIGTYVARKTREAAWHARCQHKLRSIGLALLNYHDMCECFPPAYELGPDGKRWHSWRLRTLPFLGFLDGVDCYHFDEPWDGPYNRKRNAARDWTVEEFASCPADSRGDPTETSYLAVVGTETAWPGAESTRLSDFADGPENTILLVEVADTGIDWLEPRDLKFDDLFGLPGRSRLKPSSWHGGGFYVLFADGSVSWLPDNIVRSKLRAMLTRAGGD